MDPTLYYHRKRTVPLEGHSPYSQRYDARMKHRIDGWLSSGHANNHEVREVVTHWLVDVGLSSFDNDKLDSMFGRNEIAQAEARRCAETIIANKHQRVATQKSFDLAETYRMLMRGEMLHRAHCRRHGGAAPEEAHLRIKELEKENRRLVGANMTMSQNHHDQLAKVVTDYEELEREFACLKVEYEVQGSLHSEADRQLSPQTGNSNPEITAEGTTDTDEGYIRVKSPHSFDYANMM